MNVLCDPPPVYTKLVLVDYKNYLWAFCPCTIYFMHDLKKKSKYYYSKHL